VLDDGLLPAGCAPPEPALVRVLTKRSPAATMVATMERPSARTLVDAAVVAACCLFVFTQLHPSLIFAATTPAGGDMGAHVWAPAYLRDHLLPNFRLTGWSPDWYAGFPALTFYFPLPMLLIVLLDFVLPYGVAFKLVTVVGACTLPLAAYAFGRLARLAYPGPALMAVATVPFLFDRFHTIYGGNLPATLAGEFSFAISLSCALVFLGLFARGMHDGRYRAAAAVLLAVAGLSHIIPTIFAGVGAVALLITHLDRWSWRPKLKYALTCLPVAGLLAMFWILPFQQRLPYTNDMGWERKTTYVKNLFPFLADCVSDGQGGCVGDTFRHSQVAHLPFVFALALIGFVTAFMLRRRPAMAMAITMLVFGLGFRFLGQYRLWNARLLPFWYLLAYLLAAYAVSEIVQWAIGVRERLSPRGLKWPELATPLAAAMLVLLWAALPLKSLPDWFPYETKDSSFIKGWASWNYSGYERKAAWDEYNGINTTMREVGEEHGCGRASWEYEGGLDRYGTPLAMMLLPYWTDGCIASMEGLYFESSATTPYHFLNAAEESKAPSNPQRDLPYISPALDVDKAVKHFQMLGVRYYMAFSPEAIGQAESNPDLTFLAESNPWRVYEVADSELVEPLQYEPAVLRGVPNKADQWLEVSAPWFNDETRWDVPLAASGPSSWQRVQATFGDKPEGVRTVGEGVTVAEPARDGVPRAVVRDIRSDTDTISFRVDRIGVPVVVKASYFPNWRASGADGPYRITPNFMVVVPTRADVTLQYGHTPVDVIGWLGTLLGVVAVVLLLRSRPVQYPQPPARPAAPFMDDDEFDAALYGFLPVGGLEPMPAGAGPPPPPGSAFDLAPALRRHDDVRSRSPEGDAELDEADDRPWYSTQDGTSGGPALLDDDGDLGARQPRPFRAQDELGIEEVGAEPAHLDDRYEGQASQGLDPVRVRHAQPEPDFEDRGEDEGHQPSKR
jgi:hypothetical protein